MNDSTLYLLFSFVIVKVFWKTTIKAFLLYGVIILGRFNRITAKGSF